MQRLGSALLALMFSVAALTGAASAKHDGGGGGRGNGQSCVNPAGHERGWCKKANAAGYTAGNRGGNYSTITGTVLAVNGDIAQFRQDSGSMITINEQSLLRAGAPLQIGGHYTLQGYFSNNMFVAATNGYNNNGYPGNGYPGGSASLHGVITSVSGNRVTLLQGLFSSVTINDQQALNSGAAQNLYVGRSVTAYGFWSGSVFYATSIG